MRILVVDDSEDMRDLLSILITRGGPRFEVVGEAEDGQQAVEMAARLDPDVVLLDVAMPVMDGLEALPLVLEKAPRAAVIMLSAFPGEVMRQTAVEAGAVGYLVKDRLALTLLSAVERLVAEAGPPPARAGAGPPPG